MNNAKCLKYIKPFSNMMKGLKKYRGLITAEVSLCELACLKTFLHGMIKLIYCEYGTDKS